MTTEINLDEARKLPLVNETVSAFIAGCCAADPSLRKAMQDDPRSAIAKTVSVDLSGDYELRTVQNTEDEVNIVIPSYKAFDTEAIKVVLSESELQRVAGGEIIFVGGAAVTAILATIGISLGAATVGSAIAVGAGTVAAGAAGAAVLAGGAGAVVGGAVAGGVVGAKKRKKKK